MATTKWNIDPTHSEVTFKVKHLMISTVTGKFKVFEGQAESEEEDFKNVTDVKFIADVKSIDTNNEQRDEHLRSGDFFAADEHADIVFRADKFDVSSDKLQGELTIKNITKPVTLDGEFGGVVVDPYGQTKAGLTLSGKISRKEFGLTWDAVTEAGSVVVSDQVRLNAEVQFVKQS
ncbi:YceI family protein [Antarcticibacterium sp. 1MA-6-2]|uniref:YceI family protein n=1 Tax=Antarcticibacterium sp. 1MA-6-2 TaxID=2908210 RepID=UPI001F3A234B|nr:YceI family protein [Antarcticibacterium sp. 1MA-6-2]UJH90338.1 YceI family protein [Antarcticibacterium sp. 1MA-6-2]